MKSWSQLQSQQQSQSQTDQWERAAQRQKKEALNLLQQAENYPGLAERRFSKKLLLYRYPTFTAYTSWTLLQAESHFWLRRIVWNPSCFLPNTGPEMQIVGRECMCPSDLAIAILEHFESISIRPFLTVGRNGRDGEILGVTLSDRTMLSTVQWWTCDLSDREEISQLWDESVEKFEALF